jgi:hypothetical protein
MGEWEKREAGKLGSWEVKKLRESRKDRDGAKALIKIGAR